MNPAQVADIALGNNAHLFARPLRRQELAWCFEVALGCGPVRTVEHPAMPEPMLVVDFRSGGHLSIEFIEEAPDADRHGSGRGSNCAPLIRRQSCVAVEAGLTDVKHPGQPYYVMAPGGQVFTIAPLT